MINYRKEIQQKLSGILPCYFEMYPSSDISIPCITYKTSNNYDVAMSDSFGFSSLQYLIKLWGESIDSLADYEGKVDAAMRELGFSRQSTTSLVYNNLIQLIYTYEAVGYENDEQEIE